MADKTQWEILDSITARDLIMGGLPLGYVIVGAEVVEDMGRVKRECITVSWIDSELRDVRRANFYFDRNMLKWIYVCELVSYVYKQGDTTS